jgi:hypothetical protein
VSKKESSDNIAATNRKYLDQDWKLSPEDSKDFKGFPQKKEDIKPADKDVHYPTFALMYKLRREYMEVPIDSLVAEHNSHVEKFKRIINSEVINLGKAKGLVILFAGFSKDDKAETKSDILKFMEDDPFIVKDTVEKWDILDFEPRAKRDPSAVKEKVAK